MALRRYETVASYPGRLSSKAGTARAGLRDKSSLGAAQGGYNGFGRRKSAGEPELPETCEGRRAALASLAVGSSGMSKSAKPHVGKRAAETRGNSHTALAA